MRLTVWKRGVSTITFHKEVRKMESSVKARRTDKELVVVMDREIDEVRKAIWRAIHSFDDAGISDCDVAIALGLVQYELIHHKRVREVIGS